MSTTPKYQAIYTNHEAEIYKTTRWYSSREAAQDALMKNPCVGNFSYLGSIAGDVKEKNTPCWYALRNGGAVYIHVRNH